VITTLLLLILDSPLKSMTPICSSNVAELQDSLPPRSSNTKKATLSMEPNAIYSLQAWFSTSFLQD